MAPDADHGDRHPRMAIVLFTDWVDSTSTAVRLGAAADALRRTHFTLLRGAIAATGGREIKNLGDGVMVAFDSAGDALRCAEALQQAFAHHGRAAGEPMAIRVGISAGDVAVEDGDLFGLPVVEAARLCGAAGGGEVLTTPLLQALAGPAAAGRLTPLGPRQLKGLAAPTEVLRLDWVADPGRAAPGLPDGVLRSLDGAALVGRDPELQRLAGLWDAAGTGGRRFVLLEAEPGAGKTRLAAEQAARCARDGALVLFGRCDPDLGAPLRPWTAIVGGLAAQLEPGALATLRAAHGGALARLVPDPAPAAHRDDAGARVAGPGHGAAAAPVPADPPAPAAAADGETARLRLFDAVATLVTGVAARRPVVLVLDDVNWADHATLVLLRHLLRGPDVPLLVIATARDAEADRGDAYRSLLADLLRDPASTRIAVPGIDAPATLALLHEITGAADAPRAGALAAAVRAETDGNPLFTIELLRHLRDHGDLAAALADPGSWTASSDTVRDVIAQRVAALGTEVTGVLRAAAILGRAFDLEVLAAVLDADEGRVLDALEEAITVALLVESPGRPGRFVFAHAVMQRVLASGLTAARAQLLHRRAAEVIAGAADLDPARAGEVAGHWLAAGERDRGRALTAALAAGEHALRMVAPEEAVGWFDRALHLALVAPVRDERRIVEVRLALGDAQRRAGLEAFRAQLLEAAESARAHGFDDLLVRAALANSRGIHSSFLELDEQRVGVLRSALLVVDDEDHATRALLQATLASELWKDRPRRLSVADAALASARLADDPRVLTEVLYRRCLSIAEPATVEERLAITAELTALTDAAGEPQWQQRAAGERMRVFMEAGLGDEGAAAAHRQGELAPLVGSAMSTYLAATARSWLLARDGAYEEAEALAGRTAQAATGVSPDAFAIFGAQLVAYRWDRGTLGELAGLVVPAGEAPEALTSQRASVALTLHEAGRRADARAALARGVADGLPIALDTLAAVTAVLWAEGVVRTGAVDAAAGLLERIAPWAGQAAFSGVSNFGSVARVCALLAAMLGRDEEAAAHFATAGRVDRAVGAVGPLARTLADHAEWLTVRGDHRAARPRLDEAAGLAARHGLARIAEQCAGIALVLVPASP